MKNLVKFVKVRISEIVVAFAISGIWFPSSLALKGGKTPDKPLVTKNKIVKKEPLIIETNTSLNVEKEGGTEKKEEGGTEKKVRKTVQNMTLFGMALDLIYHILKPAPPAPPAVPPTSGHAARKARLAQKAKLPTSPIGTSKANLPNLK